MKFSQDVLDQVRMTAGDLSKDDPEGVLEMLRYIGEIQGEEAAREATELLCTSLDHGMMSPDGQGRTCLCGKIEREPFDLPVDFEMREN